MGAPDLLQHLDAAGLTLASDGERLTVTPRGRLTDEMRQAIRESKRELMALLADTKPAPSQAAYWPHSSAMNQSDIESIEARLMPLTQHGMVDAEADQLVSKLMQADQRPSSFTAPSAAPAPPARLATRSCAACANLTRRRTCSEPIDAGLSDHFEIFFTDLLPDGGASCLAFKT